MTRRNFSVEKKWFHLLFRFDVNKPTSDGWWCAYFEYLTERAKINQSNSKNAKGMTVAMESTVDPISRFIKSLLYLITAQALKGMGRLKHIYSRINDFLP